MTVDDNKNESRKRHIADTGVFIWIGGPQPDTPGPSKFDTFGQLATTAEIVITVSQHAYDEFTVDSTADYTARQSIIDAAIEAGWAAVADPLDFSIGPVSTVLNRAEHLIIQRDDHHQTAEDVRADASLLAIAVQMLETGQADRINIYIRLTRHRARLLWIC